MTSTSHSDKSERFSYEKLLAFYRGEVSDPQTRATMEELINTPRGKAHWNSIRFLPLEQAAAIHDGKALRLFLETVPTDFCIAVFETRGKLFLRHAPGKKRLKEDKWRQSEWNRHVDECVYCRRMMRQVYAAEERRALQLENHLPKKELLLRDWLLQPYYINALKKAHRYVEGCLVHLSYSHTEGVKNNDKQKMPDITIRLKKRTFIGVGGHKAYVLIREIQSGKIDRVSWRSTMHPSYRTHQGDPVLSNTLSGEYEGLEFTKDLGDVLGDLTVWVFVDNEQRLVCDATLKRPGSDDKPRDELTLKVTCRKHLVAKVHGTGKDLHADGPLPEEDALLENTIDIAVLEGAGAGAINLEMITLGFKAPNDKTPA